MNLMGMSMEMPHHHMKHMKHMEMDTKGHWSWSRATAFRHLGS
jgi:hypothetical protein